MTEILGVPLPALFGQIIIGLINGSFYAILSLGFSIIFGLLNVVNFAHGAFYMLGAMVSWMLLQYAGLNYWYALALTPILVGVAGAALERFVMSRLYGLDGLYILLLTFGVTLMLQSGFTILYGSSGMAYSAPPELVGGVRLGQMLFLPTYRGWIVAISVVVCLLVWLVVERTRFGVLLRAATENRAIAEAFGINVSFLMTLTFGLGVGLAALAGTIAAPIYSVNPTMGSELMIVVFAVVVIGGMGSILGSVVTGYMLGLVEAFTKVYYPEASGIVIFVVMVLVLAFKPAGLFGKEA